MTSLRNIVILGSTGSIGTQAIEVVAANPERFRVTAISAGGADLALLARQAVALGVQAVGAARGERDIVTAAIRQAADEAGRAGFAPEILVGPAASTDLAASGADVVLNGIDGSIGLRPTLAALHAGSTLALANKESLIVGGPLVTTAAKVGQIVPVDSEHSAIAQCLRG
ncbi:MAG: 1-deoxy-D-xylulose-5-phosphate reductoisomerase, partial [Actinomycetota bacterium]|nr:1-deoxy-D-xylulose-5-phosphate reductoisomerase [Actinomycetota bacterium]